MRLFFHQRRRNVDQVVQRMRARRRMKATCQAILDDLLRSHFLDLNLIKVRFFVSYLGKNFASATLNQTRTVAKITVDPDEMQGMSDRAIRGIIAHELGHVADMLSMGPKDFELYRSTFWRWDVIVEAERRVDTMCVQKGLGLELLHALEAAPRTLEMGGLSPGEVRAMMQQRGEATG